MGHWLECPGFPPHTPHGVECACVAAHEIDLNRHSRTHERVTRTRPRTQPRTRPRVPGLDLARSRCTESGRAPCGAVTTASAPRQAEMANHDTNWGVGDPNGRVAVPSLLLVAARLARGPVVCCESNHTPACSPLTQLNCKRLRPRARPRGRPSTRARARPHRPRPRPRPRPRGRRGHRARHP